MSTHPHRNNSIVTVNGGHPHRRGDDHPRPTTLSFRSVNGQQAQQHHQQHAGGEQYTSASSSSSSPSVSVNSNKSKQSSAYEPGTGAHFMAQHGWAGRDQYGRPRQQQPNGDGAGGAPSSSLRAAPPPPSGPALPPPMPIFTPAPRQPHQPPVQPKRFSRAAIAATGGTQQGSSSPAQLHHITFREGPNYKRLYLVALICVSLLLLVLLLLFVVLLATKVLVFAGFSSTHPPSSSASIPPYTLPPVPPPAEPRLVMQTVSLDNSTIRTDRTKRAPITMTLFPGNTDANQAYDDADSFEQYQAQTIVHNALVSTIEHSTLRDMSPQVSVERLENSGADLRIVFRLSIVVSGSDQPRDQSIRQVLLAEAGLLEAYLNRTQLDRVRVRVTAIP